MTRAKFTAGVIFTFFPHSVQTRPGAQPVSYEMGTVDFNTKRETAGGVKLTTHHNLMPKPRMLELYLHSPTCLHGIVLN